MTPFRGQVKSLNTNIASALFKSYYKLLDRDYDCDNLEEISHDVIWGSGSAIIFVTLNDILDICFLQRFEHLNVHTLFIIGPRKAVL